MFIKLLIISVLLLIVSFIFIGIRIILKNNGRFPETHVSRNREMQRRGITCALDTDVGCRPSEDLSSCSACGKIML